MVEYRLDFELTKDIARLVLNGVSIMSIFANKQKWYYRI